MLIRLHRLSIPNRRSWISPWLVMLCLALGVTSSALAHHGCDGNARVRLLPDQTLAILQMDPMVLSILLKDQAPESWSPEAFEKIRPRLEQLASTLFEMRDGSVKMDGKLERVTMDVSGKVAFILKFPAYFPKSTPVSFSALYSMEMGPAFQGTLSILGPPSSPMEREGAPLGTVNLSPRNYTLTLSPDDLSKKP